MINKSYSFLTESTLCSDCNCCAQGKMNSVVLHVSHAKRITLQKKGKTSLAYTFCIPLKCHFPRHCLRQQSPTKLRANMENEKITNEKLTVTATLSTSHRPTKQADLANLTYITFSFCSDPVA